MNPQVFEKLETIADNLYQVIKLLRGSQQNETTPAEPTAQLAPFDETPIQEEPKVSKEDVRKVLTGISRDGRAAKVRELLAEFRVKKLSDVPDSSLPDLLAKAKEL